MLAAFSFSRISSIAATSGVSSQSMPDAFSSSLIFPLYLVCNKVSLSLTDHFDTLNDGFFRLLRLTAIFDQTSPLSLLFFGCLKGSCNRTSPQSVKSCSTVHFMELFLKKRVVSLEQKNLYTLGRQQYASITMK